MLLGKFLQCLTNIYFISYQPLVAFPNFIVLNLQLLHIFLPSLSLTYQFFNLCLKVLDTLLQVLDFPLRLLPGQDHLHQLVALALQLLALRLHGLLELLVGALVVVEDLVQLVVAGLLHLIEPHVEQAIRLLPPTLGDVAGVYCLKDAAQVHVQSLEGGTQALLLLSLLLDADAVSVGEFGHQHLQHLQRGAQQADGLTVLLPEGKVAEELLQVQLGQFGSLHAVRLGDYESNSIIISLA